MSQQGQKYTVKVTETGGRIHSWNNLSRQQVDHLKATIWRVGCLIKRDENTQELLSPYMLREVLIITQKGEVSGTMENITQYGKS